nr:amidohydrolase family protein [Agromyces protaetiae]
MTRLPPTIIHSARLVSAGETVPDAWVRFEGGRVVARGTRDGWRDALGADGSAADSAAAKATGTDAAPADSSVVDAAAAAASAAGATADSPVVDATADSSVVDATAAAATVVDAAGRILVPGFIDLHCHGAGGAAAEDGEAALETMLDVHSAHGTTRTVCSLVSAPVEALVPRLEAIARLAARDPRVLGAHLEGPFLDDEFRGAHDPAALRAPDDAAVDALLEASAGTLRQVTLAPEHDRGFAALHRFTGAGVAVAVGHSGADYALALAAFDAGASILTHAFNGMRGIHHRQPGPVVAAMHAPHVTLEVINDGVHLHPDVVKLAFQGAPGRVALVTDAMAATGSADGSYVLGSLEVDVRDGVARIVETGSIAGSTLTQDESLRRAVTDSGIPFEVAIAALTTVPAAAIGRADDLGRLEVGYAADAVLLADDLTVDAVWSAGRRVR